MGGLLVLVACGSATSSDPDAPPATIDGNANPTIDAPPPSVDGASCGTGFTCLPAAPTNWMGPVMVYEGPGADPAPTCPASWPTEQQTVNGGLTSEGSCDCKCADPTGLTCGTASVFDFNTTLSCQTQFNITPRFTITPGQCKVVSWTTGDVAKVNNPATTGGSCAASADNKLATPTWNDRVRSCGNTTLSQGGCETNEVCAPNGDALFDRVCIYSEGDNTCPVNSPYNQRVVYHGDFTDTRSCGTDCTCESPTGSCNPTIQFASGCGGGTIFYGQVSPTSNCATINTSSPFATYTSNPTGTCTPTNATASTTGSADPTIPSTYCCLP